MLITANLSAPQHSVFFVVITSWTSLCNTQSNEDYIHFGKQQIVNKHNPGDWLLLSSISEGKLV